MLETVKKCLSRRETRSFEERYIEYIVAVQDKSILLEMEYIKKHNKLDILKLDRWIDVSFHEAIEQC